MCYSSIYCKSIGMVSKVMCAAINATFKGVSRAILCDKKSLKQNNISQPKMKYSIQNKQQKALSDGWI